MINIAHLLWIVPLAATLGFATAAVLMVGGMGEHDKDNRDR